ncbi:chromodomain-helicase-DNA-binding protein 4 [Apostasia shenzhenica]|uniref:Chromodomain-helicase-DNA-binding protein 4 n=1 Tax=Apostasia shenzhenica TaxID=1088818 RepID=A0A2I0AS45_9ASPA|nr:chromodomain-helicase-DNA-binding protein 4 [Apostasia shenzhenica]
MMLFGEEVEDFSSNCFDGSKEEHKIFEDIFYGGCSEYARMPNFRSGDVLHSYKMALNFRTENSNISTYSLMKDSPGDVCKLANKMNAKDASIYRFGNLRAKKSNSSTCEVLNHENNELSCNYPGKTGELVQKKSLGFCPIMPRGDSLPDQQTLPFRIVESFAHGILSSYYSVNQLGRKDITSSINDNANMNYKCEIQLIGDVRAVVENNPVTSPVSQESIASDILPAGSILGAKEINGGTKDVELETTGGQLVGGRSKRPMNREMPDLLESYAHRLLSDAGWRIEPRIRRERTKLAYFFKIPDEGLVLTSLSGAWKAGGERLHDALKSEMDDNGREWSTVDEFWGDLKDVLTYIDEEAQQQKCSLSLLRRWQLLDPFIAVVFIDRRITVLKTGKMLRAVRSVTFTVDSTMDMDGEEVNNNRSQSSRLDCGQTGHLNKDLFPVRQSTCRYQLICGDSNEPGLPVQHKHELIELKSCNIGESCNRTMKVIAGEGPCTENCRPDSKCWGFSRQETKPGSLSNKFKFNQKDIPPFNSNDSLDNFKSDSQTSSCLESGDGCGCNMQMLAEDELCQETMGNLKVSTFYVEEGKCGNERDLLSEIEKPAHGECLDSSNEVDLLVESPADFASKGAFSIEIANSLLKKAGKKSQNVSVGATATNETNRSSLPKGKYSESNFCCLDGRYNDQLGPANLEAGYIFASECLNHSEGQERQTCNVLNSSDYIISESSAILEASSIDKIHNMTVKSENKSVGNTFLNMKDDHTIHPVDNQEIAFSNSDELYSSMKIDFSAIASPVRSLQKSHCSHLEESIVAADNTTPELPHIEGALNLVLSATDALSSNIVKSQDISNGNKSYVNKGSRRKRPRGFYVNDDDLLIAAIIKKKDSGSKCKKLPSKSVIPLPEALRNLKSQKRGCRLLPRAPGSGGKLSMDGKQFIFGARTVLCWLIDMGVISLKDIVHFRNPKNDELIKDGWVTRDGILCKCCTEILSVSDFKAHAGFSQLKPSLNLYIQSGKSYTLCQLQAWSAEYKARKGRLKVINVQELDQNDDTCGICADGGELICCDNCPSTYHQTCLTAKDLPDGSWYCHNCICKICNNVVSMKEYSAPLAVLECSQCEHKYHRRCFMENFTHYGDLRPNTWFCGTKCHEVYVGLRSRVGVLNSIDSGFSWTILRCNHDDQNAYSPQKIALMAECNSKLAIALALMEECFVPMVDPRTGIDMIPHVVYNWGSTFARLNYQGFYTVILEKGDTLISAASLRVHGATVAEMPLIATCGQQRRQGMCRRLLNAVEEMLKSFKVGTLVLSAIPSLVETWTCGFGFNVMDDAEKNHLKNINLMLFPGTILLKKKLWEASLLETGQNGDLYSTNGESSICEGLNNVTVAEKGQQSLEDAAVETDAETHLHKEQVHLQTAIPM